MLLSKHHFILVVFIGIYLWMLATFSDFEVVGTCKRCEGITGLWLKLTIPTADLAHLPPSQGIYSLQKLPLLFHFPASACENKWHQSKTCKCETRISAQRSWSTTSQFQVWHAHLSWNASLALFHASTRQDSDPLSAASQITKSPRLPHHIAILSGGLSSKSSLLLSSYGGLTDSHMPTVFTGFSERQAVGAAWNAGSRQPWHESTGCVRYFKINENRSCLFSGVPMVELV